ncbi:MAG: phosphate ABC transporter ATP-binding protein PstB [Candidatus Omnitrophica bacterium]|nr:phosphate ABC transporter ATP-binding protein PstB [Candidatus Omnitrophota bacterium]MCM8793771.1 phosphate ABC transporter ATP-binding protein PstB [Candidatus Omnitrophota bacterium]
MVEKKVEVKNLNVWFGQTHSLKDINLDIYDNEVLTIIGPANSGKTTFLRMLNRLNELQENFRFSGEIIFDHKNFFDFSVQELRKKIGMVFALPVPLPLTVFDNVAYGPKLHGIRDRGKLKEIVERSLRLAYLWEEVKDRLNASAFLLSGGQQQRLCIARTLACEPEIILFDEPCSGLDPVSTAKIEEAMQELKKDYTLVLVTNNVKQAARVGDRTAFFLSGELIEIERTDRLFTAPKDNRTEGYISGRFG